MKSARTFGEPSAIASENDATPHPPGGCFPFSSPFIYIKYMESMT